MAVVATKGKIVVLEGTDKAGKTTQSRMLLEALKNLGKVCVILDFPDYNTAIGAEIRAFLDGKREYSPEVKHLLFSANRWEKKAGDREHGGERNNCHHEQVLAFKLGLRSR
jgi:Thymidylate kinase